MDVIEDYTEQVFDFRENHEFKVEFFKDFLIYNIPMSGYRPEDINIVVQGGLVKNRGTRYWIVVHVLKKYETIKTVVLSQEVNPLSLTAAHKSNGYLTLKVMRCQTEQAV